MRHLNGVYTQRCNRCHGRGDHLLLAVAELLSEFLLLHHLLAAHSDANAGLQDLTPMPPMPRGVGDSTFNDAAAVCRR